MGKTTRRLIGRHRIYPVDLLGINIRALRPVNQGTTPLDGRLGSDSPAIVFDNHQYGQFMYRCLTEQNIEIVRCDTTITIGIDNNLSRLFISIYYFMLMTLDRKPKTARKRCESSYFTEAGQNAVLFAAIMGGHIPTSTHGA